CCFKSHSRSSSWAKVFPAPTRKITVGCLGFRASLLRRADEMAATATRGAVRFPRRVAELLRAGLDLRDRHAAGEISRHGLAVARGRLENQLSDLVFPPKT